MPACRARASHEAVLSKECDQRDLGLLARRHERCAKFVPLLQDLARDHPDGLRSNPAAKRELGNLDRREKGCWKNNRAANSHLPFRRRERAVLRFRQMKSLQKFASVHAGLHNHFNSERHLVDHQTYKERRSAVLAVWQPLAA